jgi:hypothetical protein
MRPQIHNVKGVNCADAQGYAVAMALHSFPGPATSATASESPGAEASAWGAHTRRDYKLLGLFCNEP